MIRDRYSDCIHKKKNASINKTSLLFSKSIQVNVMGIYAFTPTPSLPRFLWNPLYPTSLTLTLGSSNIFINVINKRSTSENVKSKLGYILPIMIFR